jgi:hypothetical protein
MIGFTAFGQDEVPQSKWSVQANIQHQDLLFQIPFGQLGVFDPVYVRPVYSIEVQRYLKDGKRYRQFLSLQTYFYNNLYHDQSVGLQLGIFKERTIYKSLFLVTGIEVGLGRIWNSDTQYILEDGVWVPTENYMQSYNSFSFGPRMDLGYRVANGNHPIDILVKSHLTLRLENQTGGLPFYGVGFGVRYRF